MSSHTDEKMAFDTQYQHACSQLATQPQAAYTAVLALNKWAKKQQNPEWRGLAQRLLAKCQKQIGEKEQAINTLQATIRLLKRNKLMQQAMQCYDELALLLHEQLAYYPALDAWLKSLEIATTLQSAYGCARAYLGVGKVHFALGDYRRAMHFHLIANTLSQPLNDSKLECEVSLSLAADAYRLGEYDQALVALSQISHHILNDLDQPEWEAEVQTYDGLIHLHFERYSIAQELLSLAYRYFLKNQLIAGQGQVMLALAKCFAALHQIDLAEECLLEAARLGQEHQLLSLSIESQTQLAKLYLESGQYQSALIHRQRLHQLIAGQHENRGFPMQLSSQSRARLRSVAHALETQKTKLRLINYVAN